ncbi:unnamed protein product [Cunninghamella blakesleeana]
MSSPLQSSNNIRQPSNVPHSSQPPPPTVSPFSHHLPPPLPSSNTSSSSPLSLPPPRVNDNRSYQNPIQSPPTSSNVPYGLTSPLNKHSTALPPPSSFASNEHGNTISKPVLPPIPQHATSTHTPSPFDDHHPSPLLSLPPPQQRNTTRTPPPISTQQQQQQQQQSESHRPLNVRDALAYLDQVKVRFSDQPEVYNSFLDIMKDFKSQAIDTPGVIERVSTLFKGHPMLISGFNTFLPPGYRIECSNDPHEPDLIRVTTPNGTTTTTTGGRINVEPENLIPPQSYYQQQPYSHTPLTHLPPPSSLPVQSSSHSIYNSTPPPPSLSQSTSSNQYIPPSHPPPARSTTPPMQNGKRSPVEFNHAINYVNKIKNRFSNEPDIYKQFLEILQTYQKEQKPIQEVYSHIQYLFNGAPDLLDEFKQFLPDITGQPASALFGDEQSSYYGDGVDGASVTTGKRGVGQQKKKRIRYTWYNWKEKKRNSNPSYCDDHHYDYHSNHNNHNNHNNHDDRSKMFHKNGENENIGLRSDPYAFPASPFDPVHPTVSAEEVELFERIRKYIGNKPSYEEFLKTLNLYTQQIIDMDLLMEQVEVFIGSNKELFDWFKSVLGYEPKEHPIRCPERIIPKPDLMHCEPISESPSYRLVPVEWQNQVCSGRDQLAWEVLNDEYVSHPIWASEDDGFIASKKSQYEEAMHRCEEERYDYNMNIEANLNVIALLEPIAKEIENMTPEEKSVFRLYPGLGGQTVSIYERIIKKVYDKERGLEIIELLYNNPVQVVPILLNRLKQKDEEWKKAQREWNKIWRETDIKNYYRSLDYQGITFKSNDRKVIAVKALVTEIETLHNSKTLHSTKKSKHHQKITPVKTNYQLKYSFPDKDIFKDVTRVVYSYIDKQAGFSNSDREKIRTFMRSFIPLFFGLESVEPEGINYTEEHEDEEMAEDEDDSRSTNTDDSETDTARSPGKRSTSPRRRSKRGRNNDDDRTMDLLRDVLIKNKKALSDIGSSNINNQKINNNNAVTNSDMDTDVDVPEGSKTPESSNNINNKLASAQSSDQQNLSSVNSGSTNASITNNLQSENNHEKLLAAAAMATAPESIKRKVYNFFCNTTFYAFFRFFEFIYDRLRRVKELDIKTKSDPRYAKKTSKVALELGLYTTKFDDIDISNGYYAATLEVIDRFFDGEIEGQSFEEYLRYYFATDTYVLYTVDKLVNAFVKQIQAVTVDADSVKLLRLFRSDQELNMSSPRILSVYRLLAEEIIGSEENLYKVDFDKEKNEMTIQLVGPNDYMLEPSKVDQYENYISSYMNWINPTEGVDTSLMKSSYLKRNLRLQNEKLNEIHVRSHLQYKIDQDTYHMYYIDGSEDVFIRPQQN